MQLQLKKIIFVVLITSSFLFVLAILYANTYYVPARYVWQHQMSDADYTVIRLLLNEGGQGMMSQIVHDSHLQKNHKSVINTYILWTSDKLSIHIYESDRTYSQQRRLLAMASRYFKKLDVRFSQPRSSYIPAQAVFRKY